MRACIFVCSVVDHMLEVDKDVVHLVYWQENVEIIVVVFYAVVHH